MLLSNITLQIYSALKLIKMLTRKWIMLKRTAGLMGLTAFMTIDTSPTTNGFPLSWLYR